MPRSTSVYVCQQCGYQSTSFLGKCPQCDNWNSFVEQTTSETIAKSSGRRAVPGQVLNLSDVKQQNFTRLTTKIEEFDRVLGGGIVKGSVMLVSGDPGIGKSTLLTQLAINLNSNVIARSETTKQSNQQAVSELTSSAYQEIAALPSVARNDRGRVLYVSGEESAQQIKIRVDRIDPKSNIPVLNEVDVDVILSTIDSFQPELVIIDSIQTLTTSDLASAASTVSQVRECATRLQRLAKARHIPMFIVGHVTKEGTIAGPKTLEHLVDVVLSLEGDSASQFRILRADKNRFGPTDEVGIFDMTEEGMTEVKNPSKIFLETKQNAPGSAVVPVLTGLRPILVEVQALVTKTNLPIPRRTSLGVDNNRLQLLVAVLQKRLGLPLYEQDVFVNVTGGFKITEPAADLAICLAIVSSYKDQVIPKEVVLIGEVGLLGELRTVRGLDKRAKEAKKLGFSTVISPDTVKNLSDASRKIFK
ncbi:MAG: DNA repair protein RadA [Candidatus Daviesbacteria bacterium]|nr:DNA repair protein RadA [Candidatus Daviesbacteria bacterium]